ncbi:MAG: RusA family crossover junction endodeoxyribonuclease [Georgenia sp.]
MTVPPSFELVVEIPEAWWMNANHRPHWRTRHELTKSLRWLAAAKAREQRLVKGLDVVRVTAYITYPRGGTQDPNNAAPTTKALIDGLTDYGCWADDDREHVIGPDHRYGGVTKGRRTIRLVLSEIDEEKTP